LGGTPPFFLLVLDFRFADGLMYTGWTINPLQAIYKYCSLAFHYSGERVTRKHPGQDP